ncbi:MAG: D-cysteine desulfhydrase family protein [Gammaproteobacteria bacterium]
MTDVNDKSVMNEGPLANGLEHLPRVRLGFLPTPLTPLDRLTEHLRRETDSARPRLHADHSDAGQVPRLWLKRDDCTGLATGGNKTRKLEYLLADALHKGASHVLTFGAVQSNHARQTAAACAAVGLPCHLILSRRVDWPHPGYEQAGNVLLDRLLGARVQFESPAAVADAARVFLAAARARGERVYVIPTGGSNAIGALGYVRCAEELKADADALGLELTDVVHASSSAGTQAGLIAGFLALSQTPSQTHRPRVHGINVYTRDNAGLRDTVLAMSNAVLDACAAAAAAAGNTPDVSTRIELADVRLDDRFLGLDYGIPTDATIAAIRTLAALEGVLMDPVYSGKAFGALLARIHAGEFAGVRDLVFIHTGGTPTLGVYDTAFAEPDPGTTAYGRGSD